MFNKNIKDTNGFDDIREWLPIRSILDKSILLKNGAEVKIIEVEPINFKLKSENERNMILENYKNFLKLVGVNMQIVIQTQKCNMTEHIKYIRECMKNEEENIREMSEDYINLILSTLQNKSSILKKFYLIIRVDSNIDENIRKIKEGLLMCGNSTRECENKEIINILDNCLNKRVSNIRMEGKSRWV